MLVHHFAFNSRGDHGEGEFCEQIINLDHPQMGFILLRKCCGTCRVVNLLRAMDTSDTSRLVEAVDKSAVDSALRMLRTP